MIERWKTPELIFLPVALVLALLPATVNSGPGELPAIKRDCSSCHAGLKPVKGSAALNKPAPELCIGCHPDRQAPGEHKVGVVPSMEVRKLPLWEGKIACITCHDPHANPYGKLLRQPAKDLCRNCHPY